MKTSTFIVSFLVAIAVLDGCVQPDIDIEELPIKIVSEKPGRGRLAEDGKTVYVDYMIFMPDGDKLMSHSDWRFVIGHGSVVEGMDDTVRGMRPGGNRVVSCPPHKHWGRKGYGSKIPPNTVLTFDVTLKRVE